jgi:hypothetical protein
MDVKKLLQIVTNDTTARKTPKQKITGIFGYRFIIYGDFNGDGKKDTLTEHFISDLSKQEMNKYYDGMEDMGDAIDTNAKLQPISFITSSNPLIDTLHIGADAQVDGIEYIKNEGDLNNDGTDEIAYVINYLDWSSCNTCHIVTYKNNKWEELYSFSIHDWQLPVLPLVNRSLRMKGFTDTVIKLSDTTTIQREKELMAYEGLITKLGKNKIRIEVDDPENGVVSRVVNISKKRKEK